MTGMLSCIAVEERAFLPRPALQAQHDLLGAEGAALPRSSNRREHQNHRPSQSFPLLPNSRLTIVSAGVTLATAFQEVCMLSGFKQFILRGNVVDLAVGVVIGAAFGGVVTALTKDLLMPFIAAVAGKPDFAYIGFDIGKTHFPVGDFINAVVSFLLIASAVYFFVVTPINALVARMHKEPVPADLTTKKCPECLSEIPIDARRCGFCTQPIMGRAA
jgi:large conductance mechanosensitive channel